MTTVEKDLGGLAGEPHHTPSLRPTNGTPRHLLQGNESIIHKGTSEWINKLYCYNEIYLSN